MARILLAFANFQSQGSCTDGFVSKSNSDLESAASFEDINHIFARLGQWAGFRGDVPADHLQPWAFAVLPDPPCVPLSPSDEMEYSPEP